MDTVVNLIAFTVLTLLWLGFLIALLFKREVLQKVWWTFRSLNILVQVVIAMLTLPVFLGLWIWQSRWPAWLRLVSVVALAYVTIYTFFPRILLA